MQAWMRGLNLFMRQDKVPEIHKFCELENVADQVLQ